MEKDIKKKSRPQTPETREKISNSQRMRFAKLNRALKENEIRKLELKNPCDNVPLDDYEMMLELRFQVADEFNLFLDAMFQFFKHQLQMEKKKSNKHNIDEMLSTLDIKGIISNTINDYINKDMNKTKTHNENNWYKWITIKVRYGG